MNYSTFLALITLICATPLPASQGATSHPLARKASSLALSPLKRAQQSILNLHHKYAPVSFAAIGKAPLKNGANQLYVCDVTIGNGQVLPLDLDTGSSDTWARGKGCQSSDGSCAANLKSIDTADKTLVNTKKLFEVTYGSGNVSGTIYNAKVSIGGLAATIPIGVSTAEYSFNDPFQAGLMGFAFNSISNIGHTTGKNANFFDGLKLKGKSNIFSFYFSNAADSADTGELTLGGVNSAKFTGPITYVPLNSQTYWQFDFSSWAYSVGSVQGTLSGNAIADTGTTLLLFGDSSVADAINQAIGAQAFDPAQQVYPIDCAIASTGPPVVLSYNGSPFSVPASIYVFSNGDGTCFSGISQFAQPGIPSILGDIFLRQYYSVYDKSAMQVGFATAVHPTTKITKTK